MTHYIYLECNGLHKKLARVAKSKTSVTGHIWNIFPTQFHIGIKDIHFTYPTDGDYHVSVNMYDKSELKIFSDRAAKKKDKNAKWEKISKEEALVILPMAKVPDYRPSPLADYALADIFFPLMTVGMGRLDIFDIEKPKPKDFVIKCDVIDLTRTPNFALMIIGKNTDPYASMGLQFIDKKIFFADYPKVFAGFFYGKK